MGGMLMELTLEDLQALSSNQMRVGDIRTLLAAREAQARVNSLQQPELNPFLRTTDAQGNLNSNFRVGDLFGVDQSRNALNSLSAEANSAGPTQAAQRLLEQNQLAQRTAANSLMNSNASNNATQISNLARTGGLDQGSRLRLARSNNRNFLDASQRQIDNNASRRLGILANDEQNKFNMRQNLSNNFLNQAQFERGTRLTDISNALGTVNNNNALQLGIFGTEKEARERELNRLLSTNRGRRLERGGFV